MNEAVGRSSVILMLCCPWTDNSFIFHLAQNGFGTPPAEVKVCPKLCVPHVTWGRSPGSSSQGEPDQLTPCCTLWEWGREPVKKAQGSAQKANSPASWFKNMIWAEQLTCFSPDGRLAQLPSGLAANSKLSVFLGSMCKLRTDSVSQTNINFNSLRVQTGTPRSSALPCGTALLSEGYEWDPSQGAGCGSLTLYQPSPVSAGAA